MEVIPSINCEDIACIAKKIAVVKKLGALWVHLDVGDGVFSSIKLWDKKEDIIKLKDEALAKMAPIVFEVHLMVKDPEEWIEVWLKAGAKRVIVHCEVIHDLEFLKKKCEEYGAELGLSIEFSSNIEKLTPFLTEGIEFVHVLSVPPGLQGQKFHEDALKRIELLHKRYPSILIEVDGGIDDKTGKLAKDAGADIFVSATYIFKAAKPDIAYQTLRKI
ncbi:MAG: Ribulose-phosphate 3-epimerase [Candidatus Jorgensenbacteria bacterium GW2011_GWA2_45_13]|uniref:Ribulose-phosphate 3-epimerase n=1 Tax=Candidatus Jorgensenbacteria bacterium GW2011_GWA2_45_13 TaxID=1618662 RepID=A0A0G1L4L6_9BACT|nr:MAG: Ribulose-phosphate 3-epimerase [Candidatus Jorgensenbacteria bacterium GW2011_GWA2_45_13]